MAKSYWNLTRTELEAECEKREIFFKVKPDQRAMVNELFDHDKEHGNLTEVIKEDEEGKIVEAVSTIKQKREGLITVIFHNKDEQDAPYVYVGLNGKSYYIPKDVEVTIPKDLISVVNDAIETRITSKKNRDGKIIYEEKRIQRFPHTIVQK